MCRNNKNTYSRPSLNRTWANATISLTINDSKYRPRHFRHIYYLSDKTEYKLNEAVFASPEVFDLTRFSLLYS